MRKFVKTAAVLALAFALLSTSAFAALTGSVAKNDDGTITATINGAAPNEQITILAVDAEVQDEAVPELTDSNILYINQKAAAGTTDTFANFTLKGESNGRTVHFFAGSATSSEAEYLGFVTEAIPYAVEVESGVSVEVNQSEEIAVTITPAGYADEVAWTVTSSNAASATISGDAISATFSATAEGVYTVRATLEDGTYGEAEVTVTPKNVTIAAPTATVVIVPADGDIAKNQNGVGVALEFANLPAGFTHMIWGFGDGTGNTLNRRYSTAVSTNGASGSCSFKAAFGNGTANGSIEAFDLGEGDVSALFWDGTDTYFTHPELDKNNNLN